MSKLKYSKDLDILIALIGVMAIGEFSQRTPSGLAKETSIAQPEIERVLDAYKSIFRKASKPKKGKIEIPYSLQLRRALQYETTEDEETRKPPIATEYVTSLINFVSQKANTEENRNLQFILAVVASVVSLVVAFIALLGKNC